AGGIARLASIEEAWTASGVDRQLASRRREAERDTVDLLTVREEAAIARLDIERQAELLAPVLPLGDDVGVADFLEHAIVQFRVAVHQFDGTREDTFLGYRR